MDRFLSHFTHRFDAKGRISIPASFRQVLAKDGFAGVYAYPSLDAPALDCGGNALIAEIDLLLQTMPPYSASGANAAKTSSRSLSLSNPRFSSSSCRQKLANCA